MAGVEGTDAGAVAEMLGVSVGAVYSNKSRVMARLRRRIEEIEPASEPERQAPGGVRR